MAPSLLCQNCVPGPVFVSLESFSNSALIFLLTPTASPAWRAASMPCKISSCPATGCANPPPPVPIGCTRSEEHTSELQSHVNLVCRLLLEKKKQRTQEYQ